MSSGKKATVIGAGNINTKLIFNTHTQIKNLVETYTDVTKKVSDTTNELRENWVGKGRNEFESQYELLIGKIDDFGDTLLELYEALVEAEAAYEDVDDEIRQKYTMSMQQ